MAGALCLGPASAGKSFAALLLLRRVPTAPSAALPAPMRGEGGGKLMIKAQETCFHVFRTEEK